MCAPFRVGLIAALATLASISFGSISASAADKAYHRADLDEAAIKLQAEIKNDAGQPGKPLAQLRRDADAAFQKNDVRNGIVILGQIIALAPDDSANWLRLSRAIQQIRAANDRERSTLLERAGIAAYVAYARSKNRNEEADSLVIVGRTFGDRQVWRPALDALRLSLELREVADVRVLYEKMREDHGFRLLDYSRRFGFCFAARLLSVLRGAAEQARRFLAVRLRRRPGQARGVGRRQAALRRRAEARRALQRHAARGPALDRQGDAVEVGRASRSTCATANRSRASPARPMCCRAPASAASRSSASTPSAVKVAVYRIGDRNLIETVLGRDFQRNLDRYDIERLSESRAMKVWSGELATEQTLNAEITTAFPVDQAIGDVAPGVYVMTAEAKGAISDSYDDLATQWFIVSDLGLAAYSGNDGINVFVNSLASAEPKSGDRSPADVARQRSSCHQENRFRRAASPSRPGFRAARARSRPRCWSRPMPRATTRSSVSKARLSI